MSIASRVAALAQRIGAELHDTGWIDLDSYLLPGVAGWIRGRVKAGVAVIQATVDGDFPTVTAPFTAPLPELFRTSSFPGTVTATAVTGNGGGGLVLLGESGALSSRGGGVLSASPSFTSRRGIR